MRSVIALALIPFTAGAVWGQSALSAKAGLIHYVRGEVSVEGEPLKPQVSEFTHLDEGQTLSTERGRAEVLLNPGTFLRVDEDSSVRLVSNELTDAEVQIVSGVSLVEVEDMDKDSSVILDFKGAQIEVRKHGLYEMDASGPGSLRVYDGEVYVTGAGLGNGKGPVKVKKGRYLEFDGDMNQPQKFDRDDQDSLYRWSARRARYIAQANASSARAAGRGSSNSFTGWTFNPLYGMYSFVPNSGYGYSPFGLTLFSPRTIYIVPVAFGGFGGYGGGVGFGGAPVGIGGGSGVAPSAGTAVRSAPAAAPAAASGGRRR